MRIDRKVHIRYMYKGQLYYGHFTNWGMYMAWCEEHGREVSVKAMRVSPR